MDNFFIVGCGRSGTSILHKILAGHSKIAIPPETGLYSIFFKNIQNRIDFPLVSEAQVDSLIEEAVNNERLETLLISRSDIRSKAIATLPLTRAKFVSLILNEFANSKNKSCWGEKTPRHVVHMEDIAADFPEAKFIFIIRDPRAVAASFKNVDASFGSKNITVPIMQWLAAVKSINRFRKNNRFNNKILTVRYENLIEKKESTLLEVQRFLKIPIEELDAKNSNLVFHEKQAQHMYNTQRELFDSSLHKWKKELRQSEIQAIEYRLNKLMDVHEYIITSNNFVLGRSFFYVYLFLYPLDRIFRRMRRLYE